MIKHGEINPLNVFDLREVSHLPPHFTPVTFDMVGQAGTTISNWIYENLEGRFYFSTIHYARTNGGQSTISVSACAAFEIPSEATYFGMMLPSINKFSLDL